MKRFFKTILLSLAAIVLVYLAAQAIRSIRVNRETTAIRTPHFILHYRGILGKEAMAISAELEAQYNRIRTELQDPPHDTITVYVHPNQTAFNNATGLPQSRANGTSRGPQTIHLMYQTWFNTIFPANMPKVAVHEFTHCVQLNILIADALKEKGHLSRDDFDRSFEAVFDEQYPRWFWEGLSDYEAGIVNKASVRHGMKTKLPLRELGRSNQIYNVGYTLVDYMVARWGKDKLPAFIRSYGDVKSVLGVTEQEFEQGWRKFVADRY